MKWWLRFGCSLTGWNANMLAQCSEASKSQLSKYTSALLILMIVWSITGFLFAQRYVGLPVWGCLLVSLVFVTIVVMIERQIILAINPTKKLALFRLFIAIIMAIVGSTVFDQTMFGKDIDKQLADNIEIQTASLTQKRVGVIDAKLNALQNEKSVLDNENAQMQEDVNNHPWVIQKSVTNRGCVKTTHPLFLQTKPRLSQARALSCPKDFVPLDIENLIIWQRYIIVLTIPTESSFFHKE